MSQAQAENETRRPEKPWPVDVPAIDGHALANLCHELRTPLQVVRGYLEILAEDLGGEFAAEPRRMVEQVRLAAAELEQTVENLLEWAGGGAGMVEAFLVGEMLAEVAPALDAMARRKRLWLRWDCQHGRLLSDRRRLHSILFNLVNNALKFTSSGGVTVRIRFAAPAQDEPASLQLEVSDTGIGIARERMGEIFEPFRQLSDSDRRRYRGLGLGLSLVARNVELLGGRLEISSQPSAGTSFRIKLPQAALA